LFERFTERARQVVVGAQEEARTLRHAHLGTEHILLAVLREEEGLAARVLESLGITIERARAEVVRIVGFGQEVTVGQIPFTEDGKRVLELSIHEALGLGHDYIGPEHILLGLVRDNKGVPARILLDSDAGAGPKIRNELMRLLSAGEAQRSAGAKPVGGRRPRHSIDKAWFDGLGGVLNGLAREIRSELDREPDTGDLVLALACSPTLAAQALRELGVNAEELSGLIERVRTHRPPSAGRAGKET
jgi:ATP-dependent Clp protease ATP-binding subunit ClpA